MRMLKAVAIVLALTTAASAEPQVLPPLYRTGNLRVDVVCANTWATPDSGLAVTVDGAAIEPLRINAHAGYVLSRSLLRSSSRWCCSPARRCLTPSGLPPTAGTTPSPQEIAAAPLPGSLSVTPSPPRACW